MLDIIEHAAGDVTVLQLTGRLVGEDGDAPLGDLVDRLLQQNRMKLVLDLALVTYIDSAGLGLLVSRYVRFRRRGGDVRLVSLTDRSRHLMAITNLVTVFATFESQAEAVRSFNAS